MPDLRVTRVGVQVAYIPPVPDMRITRVGMQVAWSNIAPAPLHVTRVGMQVAYKAASDGLPINVQRRQHARIALGMFRFRGR